MRTEKTILRSIIASLALLMPLYVHGQVPSQHGRIPPIPREPEYPETTRIPKERKNAIVLPTEPPEFGEDPTRRSAGVIGRVPDEIPPLPDGYVVARRSATVERSSDWYVLHLHSVEGLPEAPPVRVLPNQQLGLLETILTDRTQPAEFLVSGRITLFTGHNYILLEMVREGSAPTPSPTPPSPVVRSQADQPPSEQTQPAAPTTGPAREPTAEEVVRRLMQGQPRRALVMPPPETSTATRPEATPAEAPRDSARWQEETVLVDQPARLAPGENWWTFSFEDLGHWPQQKPIRVLPSQMLEVAINLSNSGAGGVILVISGEITVHKGIDYMLLRKVIVRRDLGNFR